MKNTMTAKKKVFAVIAALTLAASGTVTAAAFTGNSAKTATAAAVQASTQIKAGTYGGGQVGMVKGSECEFNGINAFNIDLEEGKTVTFRAYADEGYTFLYWYDDISGEIVSSEEDITVNADKELSLAAFFDFASEAVKVEAVTEGEGMIEGDTNGYEPEIDTDYPMNKVYLNVVKGQEAVFIAQAKDGYKFTGWVNTDTKEVLSTEERFVITPDTALNLTAVFEKV